MPYGTAPRHCPVQEGIPLIEDILVQACQARTTEGVVDTACHLVFCAAI